jgi:hypothetical protein
VVEDFIGLRDHEAARLGTEWMREHYRRVGRSHDSDGADEQCSVVRRLS